MTEQVNLFANFAQGFSVADVGLALRNAPAGFSVESLRPEAQKVDHYEIGVRGNWDTVQASLVGFYNQSDLDTTFTAPRTILRSPQKVYGLEATFDVQPSAAWQLGTTLSLVGGDRQNGVAPGRLALVGIAVSAFCAAGINLLVVMSKLRVAQALVWLAGSTYARQWDDLWYLIPFTLILLPLAWVSSRWLDLMALGEDVPQTLGMHLQHARAISVAIAFCLAASAVATVGTISFVGLIAPHASRLFRVY